MSDHDLYSDDTDTDDAPREPAGKNWEQARKKISTLETELRDARSESLRWRNEALKGLAFQAGLDPKQGITRLVLKEFESNLPEELTPEALGEFAQGYGLTPAQQAAVEASADAQAAAEAETNAQQMETFQTQAGRLADAAQPAVQPSVTDQIAALEQSGKWAEALALKSQTLFRDAPRRAY